MENRTTDSIIAHFNALVESKQPIDPNSWLEAGMYLNVLIQSEQELLFDLEQEVARLRKALLDDGKTVAYAKTMIEATDEFKNARKQKAKIDRVIEFIRLSKQHSRLASDLMRSQL